MKARFPKVRIMKIENSKYSIQKPNPEWKNKGEKIQYFTSLYVFKFRHTIIQYHIRSTINEIAAVYYMVLNNRNMGMTHDYMI